MCQLSDALRQDKIPSGLTLLLSVKNIYEIDKVPPEYKVVETLDLRNNNIEDISNIKQFTQLKKLKLDNNHIVDVRSFVDSLKGLKKLEELSIKGNPMVNQSFNFKAKIILGLKQITILDSQHISKENIKKASIQIEEEEELWRALLKEVINLKANKEKELEDNILSIEGLVSSERMRVDSGFNEEQYRRNKELKLAKKYMNK